MGINWELHRPFLIKSETLALLIHEAEKPGPKRYYRNKMSETLDTYISKSSFYSPEYQASDTIGCPHTLGRNRIVNKDSSLSYVCQMFVRFVSLSGGGTYTVLAYNSGTLFTVNTD